MGENKNKQMSLRLLFYLLFYKLYKLASWTRSKEEASIVSSFLIGFLLIQWLIYILAVLDVKNYIPKQILWVAFLLSITTNILFILRRRKYEKIIKEMETRRVPIFFHVVVYLLLSWTFVGIMFL